MTACPCCGQAVDKPSLAVISALAGLSRFEHRVLEAIWNARGEPLTPNQIADAVWHDDIDGGPEDAPMNVRILVHRLRKKLEPAGISILTAGYHLGYRIVFQERN